MTEAISRYYKRIFTTAPEDQLRPDGKLYLFRKQARDVMGMSAFKNEFFDPNYESPGKWPTWDPDI